MPTLVGTEGYKYLRADFRASFDPGDKWGSTMGYLFAVAEVLYHHDDSLIPGEWEYRHGDACDGDNPDGDYAVECLSEALGTEACTEEDILTLGTVLNRYSHILESAGKSY